MIALLWIFGILIYLIIGWIVIAFVDNTPIILDNYLSESEFGICVIFYPILILWWSARLLGLFIYEKIEDVIYKLKHHGEF